MVGVCVFFFSLFLYLFLASMVKCECHDGRKCNKRTAQATHEEKKTPLRSKEKMKRVHFFNVFFLFSFFLCHFFPSQSNRRQPKSVHKYRNAKPGLVNKEKKRHIKETKTTEQRKT